MDPVTIAALASALMEAGIAVEAFSLEMRRLNQSLLNTLEVAAPAYFQRFQLALRDIAGVIGKTFLPYLIVLTKAMRVLGDFLASVGARFSHFTQELANVIDSLVSGLLPIFETFAAEILDALEDMYESVKPIISDLAEIFMGMLKPAMETLGRLISVVLRVFGRLLAVLSPLAYLQAFYNELVLTLLNLVAELVTIFLELVNVGFTPFIDIVQNAIIPALKSFINMLDQLQKKLYDVINWVRSKFNLPPINKPALDKVSSVGAGSRSVEFLSGEELQQRAIAGALQSALGDPYKAAEGQREKMIKLLEQIRGKTPPGWNQDRDRNN